MDNTTVATAKYGTVITDIGAAKITAAILNGTKVNIVMAAVGDGGGTYYYPTSSQKALINEQWRGEIAYAQISDTMANMIDVKFIVPAEVGGFTVREASLLDEDGDTIAICNTPDAQKIPITDGVSFPLTMCMHIVVQDSAVVSIAINPNLDTMSRDEVEELMAQFADQVGSCIILENFTVPADGWAELAEPEGVYKYSASVPVAEAKDAHVPNVALDPVSVLVAGAAGVCSSVDAQDGMVVFLSEEIPVADLTGTLTLRSENLADLEFTPGTGTDCDCPDQATDEEVEDAVDDVFGETTVVVPESVQVATDQEVADMTDEVFNNNTGA